MGAPSFKHPEFDEWPGHEPYFPVVQSQVLATASTILTELAQISQQASAHREVNLSIISAFCAYCATILAVARPRLQKADGAE